MKNIAVFVSGNGTNLQAIINSIAAGRLKANLALVVCDKEDAFALTRAKKAGIKTLFVDPKGFESKEAYEKHVIGYLKKDNVDLIVLAGFMRILSPFFIRSYKNKILNIHPSILPAFKGGCAIKDAFDYGVKVTGVTVHIVNEKVDNGPILAQRQVEVLAKDTLKSLEEKIHKMEHKIYPDTIGKVLSGNLSINGRRTKLTY